MVHFQLFSLKMDLSSEDRHIRLQGICQKVKAPDHLCLQASGETRTRDLVLTKDALYR